MGVLQIVMAVIIYGGYLFLVWMGVRMTQLLMQKEFFPRLRLTDIAVLILSSVIGISYLATADDERKFPFVAGILPLIWCAVQYCYYRSVIKKGVPVNAVMKEYHMKLIREHGYRKRFWWSSYEPSREYTIYAPVMEYQAGTETVTAVYSIYELSPKWKYDETYLIYYLPSQPAVFWFPEQESVLTDSYLMCFCTLAVMLGFWFIINLIA